MSLSAESSISINVNGAPSRLGELTLLVVCDAGAAVTVRLAYGTDAGAGELNVSVPSAPSDGGVIERAEPSFAWPQGAVLRALTLRAAGGTCLVDDVRLLPARTCGG